MGKCYYCKQERVEGEIKRDFEEFSYCSDKCKEKIEDFLNEEDKINFLLAAGLFILSTLLFIFLPEDLADLFEVIFFIALGFFLIKYPYATHLTNIWLGLKRSIMLVRVIGLFCIIFGLSKIAF